MREDESKTLGPVTVVVVDDHSIWRSGVRAVLGDNFSVVGEAGTADEAIEVIRSTQPDLVLCDLHMPGGGGVAVAKTVGEEVPVVILSVSESDAICSTRLPPERSATWSSRPNQTSYAVNCGRPRKASPSTPRTSPRWC